MASEFRVPTTPDIYDRPGAMNIEWVKFFTRLKDFVVGSPGGSPTTVQYNNSGIFGGIANGASGTVLTSNGVASVASFQAVPPTLAGGNDTEVQYNNATAFGGISNGTAGFVLTSNGAGVTPSFQATSTAGSLQKATIDLSNSDIDTLNATPIQVIAAPAAGMIVTPVSWTVEVNTTGAYATSGLFFALVYNGSTTDTLGQVNADNNNVRAKIQTVAGGGSQFLNYIIFDPRAKAVMVRLTGDAVTQPGANSVARITVWYDVVTSIV